jgi:oligopeptide/dipeptide ABC transporter ATP-binding protein
LEPLLEIKDLRLVFSTERGILDLFQGLSLSLMRRELLGIVGESGSGKSTLAYTIIKLLPGNARILGGKVILEGRDILSMKEEELRRIRGKEITMVFQDPSTSLNPVFRVKDQMLSVVKENLGLEGEVARKRALELLKQVELPDPESIMNSFPFELSGGMQQRVMIAMALAANPKLIVADEPTSSVDATIQTQILSLLKRLKAERDFSLILITHSIAVAKEVSDRIAVMYAGEIVELGKVETVIEKHLHPYTEALLKSIPRPRGKSEMKRRLPVVPGQVPDLISPPSGCRFHPRCPYAMDICKAERPPYFNKDGSLVMCWLYSEER